VESRRRSSPPAGRPSVASSFRTEGNRKDLRELPDSVRDEMEFVFVENMEQVLEEALSPPCRSGALKTAG